MKHQPQRVGLTHELADEDISECCYVVLIVNVVADYDQSLSSNDDFAEYKFEHGHHRTQVLLAGADSGIHRGFGISRGLT